jgi:N6-adenosine-specific RNA methylase IME4
MDEIKKKYNVIVIDPPWEVKKIQNKQRPNQVEMDYPMMSIDAIKNMPIRNLADDNSWLFLWTTQKYLWDSKAILEGWGFHHKLTMVWEKTYGRSAGMALYGFRWNAEFILVGTLGKKDMFPKSKLIPAVFQAENIRHSQKPERFYKLIEPLGENRIDIFARQKREGWDVWGNEVESDITLITELRGITQTKGIK